jgi:hypothetical protein
MGPSLVPVTVDIHWTVMEEHAMILMSVQLILMAVVRSVLTLMGPSLVPVTVDIHWTVMEERAMISMNAAQMKLITADKFASTMKGRTPVHAVMDSHCKVTCRHAKPTQQPHLLHHQQLLQHYHQPVKQLPVQLQLHYVEAHSLQPVVVSRHLDIPIATHKRTSNVCGLLM